MAETYNQKREKQIGDKSALDKRFGPGGNLATGLDQYGRYVLMETDPATGNQRPVYLFVSPNGTDWEVLNGTDVIKRIKSAYKNQDALRKVLFEKGFITEKEYKAKSTSALNGAIVQAASEFSAEVADSYTTEGKVKFPTFDNWVSGRGSMADGPDESDLPRREFQNISKSQLNAFIDSIYMETIGRKPTDEQRKAKMEELNKIVKEGIVSSKKIVGGEVQYRQKGGFNEEQQKLKLQKQIKEENPLEAERRQAFEFMDELQKIMSGGL